MRSLTNLKTFYGSISQNTSNQNLVLGIQMINDTQRYLLQKYFNNETTFSLPTVGSQQGYKLPPNYSIMKDVTLTVGQLQWTLTEILSRKDWDQVNFLPYNADIPQYYFIYNGLVNIFPIPSSSGNTITYNYKLRATDLSIEDVLTGTVSVTVGSTTVTGVGTGWSPTVGNNETRWIQIPFPNGDGQWYQIASVNSATSITLYGAYQGITAVAGATYTMGQMPLLMEDFQDLLVYRPLYLYFSSIQPSPDKAKEFKILYDEGIGRLDDYAGKKSVNVDLGQAPPNVNPNLFLYAP